MRNEIYALKLSFRMNVICAVKLLLSVNVKRDLCVCCENEICVMKLLVFQNGKRDLRCKIFSVQK